MGSWIFASLGVFLLSVIILLILPDTSISLDLGIILLGIVIAVTILFNTFFKWLLSVNIITTQRIIDVDFVSAFVHKFSEAQLEKIEDISTSI
jgi:type III secretory pathway component EscS